MSCQPLRNTICGPFQLLSRFPGDGVVKNSLMELISTLDCPGLQSDNDVIRYGQTFACHSLIRSANCTAIPIEETMCQDTCTTFQQSLQTAFVTERYCNLGAPLAILQARQEVINQITRSCRLDRLPTTCVMATKEEERSCGFAPKGSEEAKKWCQLRPFELCCGSLNIAKLDTPTAGPDQNGSNPPNQQSNQQQLNPVIVPVSVVCGILFFVGVGLLLRHWLLRNQRLAKTSTKPPFVSLHQKIEIDIKEPEVATMKRRKSTTDTSNRKSVYTVLVTHEYKAEKEDELDLREGDRILVTCVFADGWAMGINTNDEKTGLFPVVCVSNL
jgi:hypothetical protein